jgi:phosphomannomutase
MSEQYAELISSVLAANGIRVILADRPTPTPSVSYAIMQQRLTGGVVVTASHNPPKYNGIKYKNQFGASAGGEIIDGIEKRLKKRPVRYMHIKDALKKKMVKIEDIIPLHLKGVSRYVDIGMIKRRRLRILVDSLYGAGGEYISALLSGGRISVETIHGKRETSFGGISPEPKLPNMKELVKRVKKEKFDIGMATDGDADRLGLVRPDGKLVTGHKIMSLLLLHLLEDRGMRGDVVQTICGTVLINKICKKYGLTMHETSVGFKYIADIMVKKNALIGGEETGGIGYKNYIPERDSFITSLLLLEMLAMRKKSLIEVLKSVDREYGTYEYRRMDVKYPQKLKSRLMSSLKKNPLKKILGKKVVRMKSYDGYKFICEDESWLLFRLSGTEPILRIYAEASTEKKALSMLSLGKKRAFSV